ncbi:MAG TPA: D-2-hydroxyacid dehydrogenase [Opitutaceae bacterium]|nr:D-2-hydroxyacid dehydrogenase [Opitutaceae bacterium]HRE08100.1 D-2-hydroxyacid dehydrogenase [Opitutaceae bacterium]
MKFLIDVPIEPSALAALQATGRHTFTVIDPPGEAVRPLDPALIRDADGLFCSLPPKNFAEMTAVRWVQLASTGYSQLFGLDLPARGIRATNCRGCFDVPIAEWCVAMMVNLARDARQMIRNQEAAIWDRSAQFQREIRGLTVGLWGYGGIGRETARLARQLGLKVHVLARSGVGPRGDVYTVPGTGDPDGTLPDRVFRAGEELAFLGSLDFLIVGLPLTKATDGLIGERELRALRPTAYVLNPARGPIIRQEALLQALREKWIAGAALDTHYHYPMPPDHPLWKFPNVIFTPHISGSSLSPRFKERLWDIFSINVGRIERGEPLLNELTPAQLAGA